MCATVDQGFNECMCVLVPSPARFTPGGEKDAVGGSHEFMVKLSFVFASARDARPPSNVAFDCGLPSSPKGEVKKTSATTGRPCAIVPRPKSANSIRRASLCGRWGAKSRTKGCCYLLSPPWKRTPASRNTVAQRRSRALPRFCTPPHKRQQVEWLPQASRACPHGQTLDTWGIGSDKRDRSMIRKRAGSTRVSTVVGRAETQAPASCPPWDRRRARKRGTSSSASNLLSAR